jgi:hypothetical protein
MYLRNKMTLMEKNGTTVPVAISGTSGTKVLPDILIFRILEGYTQRYFCDGTCRIAVPEALSQKDASRNGVPEPLFPAIGITRLGVSCYPTALFSNKLA